MQERANAKYCSQQHFQSPPYDQGLNGTESCCDLASALHMLNFIFLFDFFYCLFFFFIWEVTQETVFPT